LAAVYLYWVLGIQFCIDAIWGNCVKVIETDLPGCLIIEPKILGDDRGFFYENWNKKTFSSHGLGDIEIQQANVSSSSRGVLRGLHYQWPKPQGKLIQVLQGEVYDVAVDIRADSPHFGCWTAVILSAENKRQFWIPEGFAHGFVALSEQAIFSYLCTDIYNVECDAGIRWDDARLAIDWPVSAPVLSNKDAKLPFINEITIDRLPKVMR
jgi:dTDP-4-dehydrorhamnose 3,5-epimerase